MAWTAGGAGTPRPALCPYSQWKLQVASVPLTATETAAGWKSGGSTDVWGAAAAPYNILYNRVPKDIQN